MSKEDIKFGLIKELVHEDFYEYKNPFNGKDEYALGKEMHELAGFEVPIITYCPLSDIAYYNGGEFCIINKKCNGPDELRGFIEAIDFLFNKGLIK